MKARFGKHTLIDGIQMSILNHYGHGFSDPDIENQIILQYHKACTQLQGFHTSNDGNYYELNTRIDELSNAFNVVTKAKYKGFIFFVDFQIQENLRLRCLDKQIVENLGYQLYKPELKNRMSSDIINKSCYFKLHNGFVIEAQLEEVDEIWEEYSKSDYDLPMPEGLPERKVIYPEVVE